MGRYDLRPLHVHKTATTLLNTRGRTGDLKPPPWYDAISTIPPSQAMIRPSRPHPDASLRRESKNPKKASRAFNPLPIRYEEDALRHTFYKDHPWELARPRIVLENEGKEAKKWDWSSIQQRGKMLDGESVVQRQRYLMNHPTHPLSEAAAYDQARKEFYDIRHEEDIERRVAQEEALAVGAYFGKGALEVGMELEDKAFELWKVWAEKQAIKRRAKEATMYSGDVQVTEEEKVGTASTDALEDVERSGAGV